MNGILMPPIPGPGMKGIGRGIMAGVRIICPCAAACMGVNKTPRKQQSVQGVRTKRRIIILSSSGDYHMSSSSHERSPHRES
jgi:hypothetical protein